MSGSEQADCARNCSRHHDGDADAWTNPRVESARTGDLRTRPSGDKWTGIVTRLAGCGANRAIPPRLNLDQTVDPVTFSVTRIVPSVTAVDYAFGRPTRGPDRSRHRFAQYLALWRLVRGEVRFSMTSEPSVPRG